MLNKEAFHCSHRHTAYEHPNCYQQYVGAPHVGYLDIESSGLQADFNVVYSWVIKYQGERRFERYVLQKHDYTAFERDREAIRALLKALGNFNTIITFYGDDWHFDIPYCRTRVLKWGYQWPSGLWNIDVWASAKKKLKLHRNRLENVAELLGIKTVKTHLDTEIWNRASMGYDERALNYILDHNVKDTMILEEVHKRLEFDGAIKFPRKVM